MEIVDYLQPETICFLRSTSKHDVIEELLTLVEATGIVPDIAEVREGVLHREELMSTGIGLGIAIPHVRIEDMDNFILSIGISREPISDYEAIDNIPIRIVVLIIAIKRQHKEYIKLLSQVVSRLKQDTVRDAILAATTPDDVCAILCQD